MSRNSQVKCRRGRRKNVLGKGGMYTHKSNSMVSLKKEPGLSQELGGTSGGVRDATEAGKASRTQLNGFIRLSGGPSRILIRGGTGSDLSFRRTNLATVWKMECRGRRQEISVNNFNIMPQLLWSFS